MPLIGNFTFEELREDFVKDAKEKNKVDLPALIYNILVLLIVKEKKEKNNVWNYKVWHEITDEAEPPLKVDQDAPVIKISTLKQILRDNGLIE